MLEMGYEIVNGLEVLAEGGADLMLDRLKVHSGDQAATRGDRLTPWMQGSLRYRL